MEVTERSTHRCCRTEAGRTLGIDSNDDLLWLPVKTEATSQQLTQDIDLSYLSIVSISCSSEHENSCKGVQESRFFSNYDIENGGREVLVFETWPGTQRAAYLWN